MTINSTQQRLQRYADAMKRLPGVVDAGIHKAPNTWEWGMDVVTRTAREAESTA